jgi:hypothetical protein
MYDIYTCYRFGSTIRYSDETGNGDVRSGVCG